MLGAAEPDIVTPNRSYKQTTLQFGGIHMRTASLRIVPILLVLIVAFGYVPCALAENYLCQQQFALCTSAPCIPAPGNPKVAICRCDVEEGPNLATGCVRHRQAQHGFQWHSDGLFPVRAQAICAGQETLKCPTGTPWTWCLNKPCTVDPANPGKAICACDIVRTGEWITAGGNCNTATCKTAYWSGAPVSDFNDGIDFLLKSTKRQKSPVAYCQATR